MAKKTEPVRKGPRAGQRPPKRNTYLFVKDVVELEELKGALGVKSTALAYQKICTPAVRQAILDHAKKRQGELAQAGA